MIDCAIQERLRLAVDLYCHQAGRELEADSLSSEDWIVLTNIHHFLRFFYQATLATEGHTATLERVLSTMEFLLEQLEISTLECSNDSYIDLDQCSSVKARQVLLLDREIFSIRR